MNWLVNALTSTIGRKILMALTGLFLILFLVVHLIGNLQLLRGDNGEAFNTYAEFMGHNPLVQTISVLNFGFILLHIVVSILLTVRNRKARPVPYAYERNHSTWNSRNMGILGTIILIFLVVHLRTFWYRSKFGELGMVKYDGADEAVKNLYEATVVAFQEWWLVGLYVVSMAGLAFHLAHGFQSAFTTFGLNHPKYTPFIKKVSLAFSIVVPAGFAFIPVYIFLAGRGVFS
jgi:succinate dehydrogenase / fumarate reductase, cytochrome b subunit